MEFHEYIADLLAMGVRGIWRHYTRNTNSIDSERFNERVDAFQERMEEYIDDLNQENEYRFSDIENENREEIEENNNRMDNIENETREEIEEFNNRFEDIEIETREEIEEFNNRFDNIENLIRLQQEEFNRKILDTRNQILDFARNEFSLVNSRIYRIEAAEEINRSISDFVTNSNQNNIRNRSVIDNNFPEFNEVNYKSNEIIGSEVGVVN